MGVGSVCTMGLQAGRGTHTLASCAPLACLRRRRPFLVRGLENTLVKLLLSLEFFDEAGRQKIAIGEQGIHP